jgi:hypothetical protein
MVDSGDDGVLSLLLASFPSHPLVNRLIEYYRNWQFLILPVASLLMPGLSGVRVLGPGVNPD